MAKEQLNDYTYGEMLVTPGYDVDFAVGTTYSINPQALLVVPMALGMLSEEGKSISPICILEGIRRSADKFVLFCNRGGMHVPQSSQSFLPLLDSCIFEVTNKKKPLSNFHPKVWILKETSREDETDQQIKVVVMSRNLTFDNNLDMVVSLTGKIEGERADNEKHQPLVSFLDSLSKFVSSSNTENSATIKEKRRRIRELIGFILRVDHFDVDTDLFEEDGYEFVPFLFGNNLNARVEYPQSFQGHDQMTISPFLSIQTLRELDANVKGRHILVTTSGYVTKDVYDMFDKEGHKIYVMKEGMTHNDIMPTDLHAKTYLVCNPKGEYGNYLFIGSANATLSAFHCNSEFILRLQYKYGKHLVFDTFRREFLQMGSNDEESRIFEPVNVAPETEDNHDTKEMEAFVRKFITADFAAVCKPNADGTYDVEIKANVMCDDCYSIYIAPMQTSGYKVKLEEKTTFHNITLARLSDFYIVTVRDEEGDSMEKVIKIQTQGIPSKERDIAIYRSVIDSKEKFLNYLSFVLSDNPEEYMFEMEQTERMVRGTSDNGNVLNTSVNIYEQMLKMASASPKRLDEIEDIVKKVGNEKYAKEFLAVYKTFKQALKLIR